jgi:hypothetical protein
LKKAEADFNEAFPVEGPAPAPAPAKVARPGGGGPRYTEDQLRIGTKLTLEGKTAKEAAEAAGVASPNYFRRVVKERIEAGAVEVKKAAKKRGGVSGATSTRVANRVVKRVRKDDDGPQALKDLLNLSPPKR